MHHIHKFGFGQGTAVPGVGFGQGYAKRERHLAQGSAKGMQSESAPSRGRMGEHPPYGDILLISGYLLSITSAFQYSIFLEINFRTGFAGADCLSGLYFYIYFVNYS